MKTDAHSKICVWQEYTYLKSFLHFQGHIRGQSLEDSKKEFLLLTILWDSEKLLC